jgi:hypothetical protein
MAFISDGTGGDMADVIGFGENPREDGEPDCESGEGLYWSAAPTVLARTRCEGMGCAR